MSASGCKSALALSAILFLIPISLVWLFAGDIVCAMNLQSEELEFLERCPTAWSTSALPPPRRSLTM
jgi:hypothetical protein